MCPLQLLISVALSISSLLNQDRQHLDRWMHVESVGSVPSMESRKANAGLISNGQNLLKHFEQAQWHLRRIANSGRSDAVSSHAE